MSSNRILPASTKVFIELLFWYKAHADSIRGAHSNAQNPFTKKQPTTAFLTQ